jgi:hypothetical protein
VRKAESEGGFASILRRGDSERGSLLLVIASRGTYVACLQRSLDFSTDEYRWALLGPKKSAGSAEIRGFLDQQARFDPDSWQIELDTADPERFIAETIELG